MFDQFYTTLESLGIVPVVVLDKVEDAAPLAHALMAAGMKSAEVTFRTACAAECIAAMAEAEPEMCVGAGTVLTVEQVEQARAAGAKFIVSPGYNEDVVKHCIDIDLPVLPGTVTPPRSPPPRTLASRSPSSSPRPSMADSTPSRPSPPRLSATALCPPAA